MLGIWGVLGIAMEVRWSRTCKLEVPAKASIEV